MTSLTLVKFLFHIALVGIGCLLIIHEKKIARFERELAKNIKYFFKGVYVTLKQKNAHKAESEASDFSENLDSEYSEILSRLAEREVSKQSCEDVLVA
jgi:hypothetical protein